MIRSGLLALVVLAGIFMSWPPVFAADPVVTNLKLDAAKVVTVGDRVTYTAVVEVDKGTGVTLSAAELPDSVSLVAAPTLDRVALDNGREQVTLTFQLAPFAPGEITIPPLQLRYSNPDGTSGVVQTPGSVIEVTSVLPASGQVTPRGLKAQAEVGNPPAAWVEPALGGLVAILVVLLVTLLVRRRISKYQEIRALQREPVVLGPEDMARQLLDGAGTKFSASGDLVGYYTTLGNAVRGYLTERYEFPAFALTTRELEAEMTRMGIDRWQVRVASGLLEQCDAVVYARYRPAPERADADLTAAYEVIEMSRPRERSNEEREGVPVS